MREGRKERETHADRLTLNGTAFKRKTYFGREI